MSAKRIKEKKFLSGDAGDRTRGLSHAKRTRYHCATSPTMRQGASKLKNNKKNSQTFLKGTLASIYTNKIPSIASRKYDLVR